MNNGNFNGYNPNGNGQNNGFMGGYDPNSQPNNGYNSNPYPPQNNGYQPYNNTSSPGYAPYQGGTYSNPSPQQGYTAPQSAPQQGYAAPQSTPQQPFYAAPQSTPQQPFYAAPQSTPQQPAYAAPQPASQNAPYAPPQQQGASGFGIPIAGSRSGAMTLSDYSKKIFLWMGAGLALTFVVALGLMLWLTAGDEINYDRFSDFLPLFYGGLIVEVVLAIVLNIFVKKMPYGVSLTMFIVYSVVSGVTLTPLLVVYDAGSAIFAFAAAAVLFIAFAIYGIVTKRDLTKLGPILLIGLVVLLLFTLLGFIFQMSGLSIIISIVGIIIFIGLTAYDTQKIKANYNAYANNPDMLNKTSVNMALQLYLDFINLFIYILRLMGNARK